jgi:hypothetical protein
MGNVSQRERGERSREDRHQKPYNAVDLIFHPAPFKNRPQFGRRNSLDTHPVDLDSGGSGTVIVFMKLHLGHSKTRFSLHPGKGVIRASLIRVRQREQYGRSIGIKDEDMDAHLRSGGSTTGVSLSPNTAEDWAVMLQLYKR